jgi:hypothetical protein
LIEEDATLRRNMPYRRDEIPKAEALRLFNE